MNETSFKLSQELKEKIKLNKNFSKNDMFHGNLKLIHNGLNNNFNDTEREIILSITFESIVKWYFYNDYRDEINFALENYSKDFKIFYDENRIIYKYEIFGVEYKNKNYENQFEIVKDLLDYEKINIDEFFY